MQPLDGLSLSKKVILEIGTGNGGTTLEILNYMEKYPSSTLISVDINAVEKDRLIPPSSPLYGRVTFIQDDAIALSSLSAHSVDIVIADYTLCAINSSPGKAGLALTRIGEVIAPGGLLFIEEEFPIGATMGAEHTLWKKMWQLIKSMAILAGKSPNHELDPVELEKMLHNRGFSEFTRESGVTVMSSAEMAPHFRARSRHMLPGISDRLLRLAYSIKSAFFYVQLKRAEAFSIPYYALSCRYSPPR